MSHDQDRSSQLAQKIGHSDWVYRRTGVLHDSNLKILCIFKLQKRLVLMATLTIDSCCGFDEDRPQKSKSIIDELDLDVKVPGEALWSGQCSQKLAKQDSHGSEGTGLDLPWLRL